ncbi:MAG: discoidin domain-containing protein [Candidatus Omnitrophota bacterium]|nr:discoidin domain-containing protein [Candidatus Omnitrophota bacterium]
MIYSTRQESTKNIVLTAVFVFAAFFLEWLLFKSYVMREIAWSPYIHDDETWYLPISYEIFERLLSGARLSDSFNYGPHGFLYFVQAAFMYLFFGASRLTALSLNFLYYIACQLVVFITAYRLTQNRNLSYVALGLALLLPGHLFFGTMTFFSHDFVAPSLFWIFISIVLGSDVFRDTRWSIAAGLVAGTLIFSRYIYVGFLAIAYFLALALCIAFFIIEHLKARGKGYGMSEYAVRIKNILLSGVVSLAVCGPFITKIFNALSYRFGRSFSGVSREYDYILWGQGAGSGPAKYIFYPGHLRSFLSNEFWIIGAVSVIIVLLGFAIRKIAYRKAKKDFDKSAAVNFKLVYLFFAACLIIFYFILTEQLTKSGQLAAIFIGFAFWIVMLAIFRSYDHITAFFKDSKVRSFIALSLAIAALLAGSLFQVNMYLRHAKPLSSPEARNSMLMINKMYNDIGNLCEERRWPEPAISVDGWVWYLYGSAKNLTALYYEKSGILLSVQPKLGQNLVSVDEKTAMDLINDSDIVILGAAQEGAISVMEPQVKAKISGFVKNKFQLLREYPIKGSLLAVYYQEKSPAAKARKADHAYAFFLKDGTQCKVTASSSGAGHTPPRAFDGSTEADDFWEAGAGEYPQWVELIYSERQKISKYELCAGYAEAEKRMPQEWKLQGSSDGEDWTDLDYRQNEKDWKPYESRAYAVANPSPYQYYRFYFIAGNSPLVRIYEIKVTLD